MKISCTLFLLFGFLKAWAFEPCHTYLTWQKEETYNHITVNIQVDGKLGDLELYFDKVEASVYKRLLKEKPKHFIKERFLYHFTLENLEPDTAYAFVVGNPQIGFSKPKKFKTPPFNSSFFRFIEGGDLEDAKKAQNLLKAAASYNPHALILGGDYPSLVFSKKDYPKWDIWLTNVEKTLVTKDGFLIPLIIAIGNHEVTLQKTFKKDKVLAKTPFYFAYFPQETEKKQSFFLKKFGPEIVFLVLDSGHCHSPLEEQRAWLHENLKKYQNCRCKFAIYHVPTYPSVRFLSEKNFFYKTLYLLSWMRNAQKKVLKLVSCESLLQKKAWLPLFDQYHLTAAFEHHDGALKRTWPLKNGQIDSLGTTYLGDGAFAPANQIFPFQAYLNRHFAKTIGYVQFFWLVDVFRDKIVYKAVSEKGKILDVFESQIQKRG